MKSINKKHTGKNILPHKETMRYSVVGTLNPVQWDNHGRVIQYSIYSEEEEEDVIIESYYCKKDLDQLLNKRVIGTGDIRVNQYGEKFIKLKHIRSLRSQGPASGNIVNPAKNLVLNDEYAFNIPSKYALSQYLRISDHFSEVS